MERISDYIDQINDAEMVLIGIGEEFEQCEDRETILGAYNKLHDYIGKKNYYIVSMCKDSLIYESNNQKSNISTPLCDGIEGIDLNEKWDLYLNWLTCTLNRKLLIIELGVSMNMPQVIRWPFEKTIMINNKASMIRVNNNIPNIPAEIKNKAVGIKESAIDFIVG